MTPSIPRTFLIIVKYLENHVLPRGRIKKKKNRRKDGVRDSHERFFPRVWERNVDGIKNRFFGVQRPFYFVCELKTSLTIECVWDALYLCVYRWNVQGVPFNVPKKYYDNLTFIYFNLQIAFYNIWVMHFVTNHRKEKKESEWVN